MPVDAAPLVRVATAAEADEIANLVRRGLAEYREASPVVYEGYLRYSLDDRAGAMRLVAELDGRIVGSVLFEARVIGRPTWPAGAATFQTLVIDPSVRRMGIGALLVRACLDRASASGASAVIIDTMPWLTAADRIYGPHGFVRWPKGDWDATPLLRQLLGIDDAPPTMVSAWRRDFR